ncbi:peptidase M1 [Silvibacterium dinghuense]|uniref:Aminopeptidase N n=1 Tax=Silvibacterium dinghuense TaxID=1560006 RepID=A0A4Q1SL86_9BACT|nr:peptidase M1 [Silvibacterium dinghuense]
MTLAAASSALAQAPAGIPRELAKERAARVSDVRYALHYTLVPHSAQTEATEILRFRLVHTSQSLLLDFRDGKVASLTINGTSSTPDESNGHLILPADKLHAGENTLELHFVANTAPAEKAITRFEDHDDGSEYIYTLFVPMDASMAFPCFDQPALKGRFQLTMTAPAAWTVISNTGAVSTKVVGDMKDTAFAETHPISTYLFAFAAGPFEKIHSAPGLPGLYVRKSKAQAAQSEAPEVQQMAADGIAYLGKYFAQPYPFPKYDMVLIPGFAYGGMEHAGATFLREESVLFRTAPTATNLRNRDILVLHELTHQWFGDFTTMRWFDDLWLKEGFAQYMAYDALAALHPNDEVWKHFYESIKPGAYGIDETQGTTPIYQDIPNLKDAKSAYGAIVYSKAPGVLRQLAYVLGEHDFQLGLQQYLAAHRYSNAEWSDLIGSFEQVSGKSLQPWAAMWIRHRGMPQVEASWSCTDGKLARLTLSQHDVLGTDALWPIASEVLLGYADGRTAHLHAQFAAQSADIPTGSNACPAYVFANENDHGYGLYLLDEQSRDFLTQHIADANSSAISTPFTRTLLWGALWDAVRTATYNPADYAHLVLAALPNERDESLTASLLGHSQTALHRYVGDATRTRLTTQFATLAVDRMQHDAAQDLRIDWFRSLNGFSESEAGRSALRSLLNGTLTVPGVTLRQQDRWSMITALVAYADPHADAMLAAEEQRDPSGDGKKFAWAAHAAHPDAATKQQYFDEYLHNPQRPEDWIESSLGAFNYWNQSRLTATYMEPALEALPQIKQTRKIFFLVGWLNAFMDGQQSEAARDAVYTYLKDHTLDEDLRLKILQVVDELDRTVAIRKKYPNV